MGLFPAYRRQAAEARGEPRNANGLTAEQERFHQLTDEIGKRNAPYLALPPLAGLGTAAGIYAAPITARVAIGAAGRVTGRGASGFGDLTHGEVRQIQRAARAVERGVTVVGSAARGQRRGVGSGLPIGKGPGTRSDIDYVAPPSHLAHWAGFEHRLPSINIKPGNPPIIPGRMDPWMGPGVKISPKGRPERIPGR